MLKNLHPAQDKFKVIKESLLCLRVFAYTTYNCDTFNKKFTKVVKKPLPFNPWKNCAPEGWS